MAEQHEIGTPETVSPEPRKASVRRSTRETTIQLELTLDGSGRCDVQTGIGFLDHLLDALARHARLDLTLRAEGALVVDDHHTAEDCGIVLGQALYQALGDRRGIHRFGHAYAPLDEALVRTVVDLSGRPHAEVNIDFHRDAIGELACENIGHVLESIAINARLTLHVDLIRGRNDHHKAEAAFKATALALRAAVSRDIALGDAIPSTKGAL